MGTIVDTSKLKYKVMADNKALVYSILRFLDGEKTILPEEQGESIEVAQQCLESVFGVSLDDPALSSQCQRPLQEIFRDGHKAGNVKRELTPQEKEQAEKHKNAGNDLMRENKYTEALVCYTEAIAIDNSNAVYFCNRAAAYSKLEQHTHALEDCNTAITLDPKYSKAFGRKGLAHSSLEQHDKAKACYETAIELDPENQSYKQNLEITEQKLRELPAGGGGMPGMPGGLNLGGMDFSSLLSNPALMNMATNMLQNPQMQEMMANMMSGVGGGGQAGNASSPEPGISGLLQAGQNLAQQMQQSNPELVEQLRSQMRENPENQPNSQ